MAVAWDVSAVFDPAQGSTVVAAPAPGAGNWAGAATVWSEADDDTWLVYRLRAPHPARGHLLRIARSRDGVSFDPVWEMSKDAFGAESIERCALARVAPRHWRLFASYVDPQDRRWRIDVMDAPSPDRFVPSDRVPLWTPDSVAAEGVKDPMLIRHDGRWRMFVSVSPTPRLPDGLDPARMHATGDVFATGLSRSTTGLAVSADCVHWTWKGEVLTGRPGMWDAYAARIVAVTPFDGGHLAFYDGSRTVAENYEERTGLAYSADLLAWERVSSDGPALVSPYGTGSLRYAATAVRSNRLRVYYEIALADGSHEVRLNELEPR